MSSAQVADETIVGRRPNPSAIFEAKLEGVRCSSEVLPRPRLTGVLAEARPTLVLLAAPPGFGKTTVLAQWREADGRPFACVSLDGADNDPAVFWSYVVEAIRRFQPSFGASALAALPACRADVAETVLPAILSELESLGDEIVLVLDDYQVIESRECHDSVAFLLERRPRNVTVALSSRSDPPIPIGRLRATGELLEVRALDLCLTRDEAAAFLNETLQLGLSSESVTVLHERTEGWPVGVQLASLSLRTVRDPTAFVARFGGSSRHVVDYLAEVVLDTLEPDVREFLLETSILESMNGALCDAVTGRENSAAVLLAIERANLFLLPLDDRREWYRYHQLFAETLRTQLARRDEEHRRELHRRASRWLGDEGRVFEAVRHAIAAGDLDAAADLVAERWVTAVLVERAEPILRWLDLLPAARVEHDARLALARAWALSRLDRREEALEALADAEAAESAETFADGTSLEALGALARACFPYGDARTMASAAARASELEGERRSAWQPTVLFALGSALVWGGTTTDALTPLRQAARLAGRRQQWLVASASRALLARALLSVGDMSGARAAAAVAVELVEAHGLADEPSSGFAYTALGVVRASEGELHEASVLLQRGLARLRARGEELFVADALLALAPVRRALGAREEARALLAEARALVQGCTDPGELRERLEEVTRTMVPAHRRIDGDSELTERELEVLRYLADGLAKREIGEILFLSFNTIHSHTKSIYQKLRVSSRQAAVQRARELGAI